VGVHIDRHFDGTVTISVPRGDDVYEPAEQQLHSAATISADEWKALSSKASMDETAKAEVQRQKDHAEAVAAAGEFGATIPEGAPAEAEAEEADEAKPEETTDGDEG